MINPINVNMNADKIVHLINDCMNINVDVQLIVHINVNVNFYINIHIIYMTLYIWVKILLHSIFYLSMSQNHQYSQRLGIL